MLFRSLLRGARHVLGLVLPYLEPEHRAHLHLLLQAYQDPASLTTDETDAP